MRTMVVSRAAMLANSYMDFHARGLDYLCLQRDELFTRKVYFFDRAEPASEVVAPHDHRYDFQTTVLAGELHNWRFQALDAEDRACFEGGDLYEQFSYRTPLNGGDGFAHEGERVLYREDRERYLAGQTHAHRAAELHTIGVPSDRTVIELTQSADVVPVGEPTLLFKPLGQREPPSLAGLYSRMTPERLDALLRTYAALTGTTMEVRD